MLVDYITINMLHLLITNSVSEFCRVLDLHTQFIPPLEEIKNSELPIKEIERPKEGPEVSYPMNYP